ncbi:MAG: LLM class F420-dependent oxidoreductase [Dehalococcoidia bacterium]|nr:LLM class F420-dependent oxidoreductase [Dehalococcoidia bacterium]
MKFGITMFPTDYAIGPGELAREVEAHGFESLFFPEHTHIPASRKSPWPGGPDLPEEYSHTLDLFVARTAAAAATERLLGGSGICLVIQRDPITLAKEVASLDHVSGGRALLGIGAGWNLEEMENHGTDPARRWRRMRETIEAMQAIWANDEGEYHGELIDFDPIWQWPKPVQDPHPPVIIGGDGPTTLKRVARYGDGWMPIDGRNRDDFAPAIAELNDLAAEQGRGPMTVSLFGSGPNPARIEKHAKAGVDRIVFLVPPAPADVVLPVVEERARLAEQFA